LSDGQGPILQAYPFCESSTPEKKKKKKKLTTMTYLLSDGNLPWRCSPASFKGHPAMAPVSSCTYPLLGPTLTGLEAPSSRMASLTSTSCISDVRGELLEYSEANPAVPVSYFFPTYCLAVLLFAPFIY
jgi:hypothetical protein